MNRISQHQLTERVSDPRNYTPSDLALLGPLFEGAVFCPIAFSHFFRYNGVNCKKEDNYGKHH